jgi:hypothetical protein
MAFWASSGVLIVTKPNPRGRPVARSIIKLASTTVPCAANASCRSFSVMLKLRFPTNNFALICSLLSSTNFAFTRLFPPTGFQIITEPSSPEDLPCRGSDKLSDRCLEGWTSPAELQALMSKIGGVAKDPIIRHITSHHLWRQAGPAGCWREDGHLSESDQREPMHVCRIESRAGELDRVAGPCRLVGMGDTGRNDGQVSSLQGE